MADVLELDYVEEFDEEHISKLKEKAKRLVNVDLSIYPPKKQSNKFRFIL